MPMGMGQKPGRMSSHMSSMCMGWATLLRNIVPVSAWAAASACMQRDASTDPFPTNANRPCCPSNHPVSACTVVECYQGWCGPCKAIQGTFKRIYFDAGDKPLKFFTVSPTERGALWKRGERGHE